MTETTNSRKRYRCDNEYDTLCTLVNDSVFQNNAKVKKNLVETITKYVQNGNSEGIFDLKSIDSVLDKNDCYNINTVVDEIKKEKGFYVTILYDWMFDCDVKDCIFYDLNQKV